MNGLNIYDTAGAVIGSLSAGADALHITGLVDKSAYGGGSLVGKAVVAQHVNGNFYIVEIDSTAAGQNPDKVAFTGHAAAQVVSNFVPKPLSSVKSVLNALANDLSAIATGGNQAAPPWPLIAGGVVLVLLLRRDR